MGEGNDFEFGATDHNTEGEETQTVYSFDNTCPEDRETGDYFLETLIGGVALLGILAIVILIAVSHH